MYKFIALFLLSVTAYAQTAVPWLTRSHDNQRTNWNNQETTLTQANVISKGLVLKTTIPVYGDARGVEAQPLIDPSVPIPTACPGASQGQPAGCVTKRDVMVLCSMANQCRGVDAHTGADIWDVTLGMPITGSTVVDMWKVNDHWGALSTGVIDQSLNAFFQVAWISADKTGDPHTGIWQIFVLDVGTGQQLYPPVTLTGGTPVFSSQMRKQRSSLVETTIAGVKTVFGCSGTIYETVQGAAGYCFAFDVGSHKLTAMQATTDGDGAGIWMAGQGLVADTQGYLYAITGNGDFDGSTAWGESFIKMRYTPPGKQAASISVIDNWTPWTDLARTGQAPKDAVKIAGKSAPSEDARTPVNGMMPMVTGRTEITSNGTPLVYPLMAMGAWADEDWGSAGPACLFQINVCIAAGKDGIAYPIHSTHLGQTRPADLINPAGNYAKLAGPPVWLTMNPGNEISPAPQNPLSLNFMPHGDTAHMHMTPVQMYDPILKSWTIFAWGENNQLHKWKVASSGALTWVANGHEYASSSVFAMSPGGMPGGFCAGSSNGGDASTALLVCSVPYLNANKVVGPGHIVVYDPIHLGTDGFMRVLWDSATWGWNITFNKFMAPVIDAGQVYLPNYSGGVMVLGLTN